MYENPGGVWTDTSSWKRVDADALHGIKNDVVVVKNQAITAIRDEFGAQKVVPEMLSESTKQLINASGGGTITNLADDEDLTSTDNVLKIADRSYNPATFSGLGYKILRRNIVQGKNVLTQEMVNQPNTVYVVRYDFDLNGKTIDIPEGCSLFFDGGKLSNGTINGKESKLIGEPKLFCDFGGTFNVRPKIKWFLKRLPDVADNLDFSRALKFAYKNTHTKILDLYGEKVYVKGEIVINENMAADFINGVIEFEPIKDYDCLFRFNSSALWIGNRDISNLNIKCKNTGKFRGVSCINFERWYNTAGWKISDIYVSGFSGYFIVNQSYLQEGFIENITGHGTVGFISYNVDKSYGNDKGTSNIIRIRDVSLNNILSEFSVPYILDFGGTGHITIDNATFQGVGANGVKTMRIDGYVSGVVNYIKTNNVWVEFTNPGFDGSVDINRSVRLDIGGTSSFNKITKVSHPQ